MNQQVSQPPAPSGDGAPLASEAVGSESPPVRDEPSALPQSEINIRNASLLVIAVLTGLAALRYASAVFIPLVMAIMFSYALTPLVNRLAKWHVPRALSAALLLLGLLGGVGATAYTLSDDTLSLIETLPTVAQKLRRTIERQHNQGPAGAFDKVQKAASEIERTAEGASSNLEPAQGVAKVQIEKPKLNVKDYLLPGTLGLAGVAGQSAVVLFITFFLLAAGNNFRRKMVKLAGPTLTQKKLTLSALDEIDQQIQRYLLVQVFTSSLVGIATWLAFLWIGVEHAAVWGVVSFVCNFIPYLGGIVASAAAMLVGFAQFGSLEMALLIGGVRLLINVVDGYILQPWLASRASRMNPVAIFAGVLAWGWLWGIWGLFLGVPILMVIKVVCDRVDEFKAVGELLGE